MAAHGHDQGGKDDEPVALITGGSNGIGAGVARRLAGQGFRVVLADVDRPAGSALAAELCGLYVECDVRRFASVEEAVDRTVEWGGGLDLVHLNAGIATGCGLGEDFDLEQYHLAMQINLDGVVHGLVAARPALEARGGGDIVATSSLAGLLGTPFDPIYSANKHAVVGLVRSMAPVLAPAGIRVNALCPGFARTAIVRGVEDQLEAMGFTIMKVDEVVDAFMAIVQSRDTGQCWFVQPGRPSEPFLFRQVPGPRGGDRGPAVPGPRVD